MEQILQEKHYVDAPCWSEKSEDQCVWNAKTQEQKLTSDELQGKVFLGILELSSTLIFNIGVDYAKVCA